MKARPIQRLSTRRVRVESWAERNGVVTRFIHEHGDKVSSLQRGDLTHGDIGGFFVFEPEFFDYLNDDPGLFLEFEPLRNLASDGQLSVYHHEDYWESMDTYRDYLHLNKVWKSGSPPWRIWEE